MKKELKFVEDEFRKGVIKLKEGISSAESELEKDGVIQRFEFTFELLWKSLKVFLKENGIEVRTPRESLKEAFRIGWIREEKVFLDMLEDRNKTSHIYDQETAQEIFERIKERYFQAIEGVLCVLRG
ncbi:MAG: nucleotidyltransferase substrate binding protein [Candidatus Omnitrophica bacterium]|nr:nucleotidyltransferase substrate binding protein [Candidatus Omnitrophota bacterium]MBU0879124.1 nucleotidyltransferase substrate binding protein [Candidatus Omnitrophota bacterium]MBU1134532.1 nucleotidyltransferase substrate binding protein [Candidatus Omnitrophota bacterium]MBU1367190.1 nucleotidyltransferase substrate binding protein [Candidatus Omnitrophota bacterium]MBU1523924.1 nucleotidyltransferase substrate binding protein [Candidatus Omnitrophota bacterium]